MNFQKWEMFSGSPGISMYPLSLAFCPRAKSFEFVCHFRKSAVSMPLPCSLNVKDACEKLKKVEGGNLKKEDAVKKMKYLNK